MPTTSASKRPRALVAAADDPVDAAESKRSVVISPLVDAAARALLPAAAVVAPAGQLAPAAGAAFSLAVRAPAGRAAPAWVHDYLLPSLELPSDVPLHFIAEKTVSSSDVDAHQNRFFIPSDGVRRHLCPLLSRMELVAANLFEDGRRFPSTPREQQGAAAVEGAARQGRAPRPPKRKRPGRKHGGLSVRAATAGAGVSELELTRWTSTYGTVIKGEGFAAFIRSCGFRPNEAVEIWAFRHRRTVRFFGVDLPADGPVHIVIAKRDDQRRQPVALPQPAPVVSST